jgi:type IV secretory pathway VirB2 component (pilin)
MTTQSPYLRHLLLNLRKALVVVAVVGLGLTLFANYYGQAVRWDFVLYIAIGMVASALINSWIDARKEGRGVKSKG